MPMLLREIIFVLDEEISYKRDGLLFCRGIYLIDKMKM